MRQVENSQVYHYIYVRAKSALLSDQEKYADECGVDLNHRIGVGQNLLPSCKDPTDLIGKVLKSGDTLVLYDLYTLGETDRSIYTRMKAFHSKRIRLVISTIGYDDDLLPVKEGGTGHYQLLSRFLERTNADGGKRFKHLKKHPVRRGPRGNTYGNLPPAALAVLEKYDKKEDYPFATALRDFCSAIGENVSRDTFYRRLKDHRAANEGS